VKEVVQVAREVTEHSIPAVDSDRRPGDAPILVASSETISRELGWKPKFPGLRAIVESAWKWHSTHPRGYDT
jgi:UDP-glucose 4-epimerase